MSELSLFLSKSLLGDQEAQTEALQYKEQLMQEKNNIFLLIKNFENLDFRLRNPAVVYIMQFLRIFYLEYDDEQCKEIYDFCSKFIQTSDPNSLIYRQFIYSIAYLLSRDMSSFENAQQQFDRKTIIKILFEISQINSFENAENIGNSLLTIISQFSINDFTLDEFYSILYIILSIHHNYDLTNFSDFLAFVPEKAQDYTSLAPYQLQKLWKIISCLSGDEIFNEEQNSQLFSSSIDLLFNEEYNWETCLSAVNFLDMIIERIDKDTVLHIIDRLIQLSCQELLETGQVLESFYSLSSFLEIIESSFFLDYIQNIIPTLLETDIFVIIVLTFLNISSQIFSNELNSHFSTILEILQQTMQQNDEDDPNREDILISCCTFIAEANLERSFSEHSNILIDLVYNVVVSDSLPLHDISLAALDRLIKFVDTQDDNLYNKIFLIKDNIFDDCKNAYFTCLASTLALFSNLPDEITETLIEISSQCFNQEDLSDSPIGVLLLEGLMKREESSQKVAEILPTVIDILFGSHVECYIIEACQLLYSALIELRHQILENTIHYESLLQELSSEDQNNNVRIPALLPLSKLYKLTQDSEHANPFFQQTFPLLESMRDSTIGQITHAITPIIPLLSQENVFILCDFVGSTILTCSSSFVSELMHLLQKIVKFRNEETSDHIIEITFSVFQKIIDNEVAFRHETIDGLFTESIFIAFCDLSSVFFQTKIPQCKLILEFLLQSIKEKSENAIETMFDNEVLYPGIGTLADAIEQQIVDEQDINLILELTIPNLEHFDDMYVRHNITYLFYKMNENQILTEDHLSTILPFIIEWFDSYSNNEVGEDSSGKKSIIEMLSTFILHASTIFSCFEQNLIHRAIKAITPSSLRYKIRNESNPTNDTIFMNINYAIQISQNSHQNLTKDIKISIIDLLIWLIHYSTSLSDKTPINELLEKAIEVIHIIGSSDSSLDNYIRTNYPEIVSE